MNEKFRLFAFYFAHSEFGLEELQVCDDIAGDTIRDHNTDSLRKSADEAGKASDGAYECCFNKLSF